MGRGQTPAVGSTADGRPTTQAVTRDTMLQGLNELTANADASGDFSTAEIRDAAQRTTSAVDDALQRGENVTMRRIGSLFSSNLGG